MNRRDMLKTAGATMIASQMPQVANAATSVYIVVVTHRRPELFNSQMPNTTLGS